MGTSSPRANALPDPAAAALCYLFMPVSALALLLIPPYSARPFIRFHALQAIFTFAAMVALTIALRIFAGIFFLIPLLGRLILMLGMALMWAGCLALWIWLMAQALQGRRFKLPWLGPFAEQQAGGN